MGYERADLAEPKSGTLHHFCLVEDTWACDLMETLPYQLSIDRNTIIRLQLLVLHGFLVVWPSCWASSRGRRARKRAASYNDHEKKKKKCMGFLFLWMVLFGFFSFYRHEASLPLPFGPPKLRYNQLWVLDSVVWVILHNLWNERNLISVISVPSQNWWTLQYPAGFPPSNNFLQ